MNPVTPVAQLTRFGHAVSIGIVNPRKLLHGLRMMSAGMVLHTLPCGHGGKDVPTF